MNQDLETRIAWTLVNLLEDVTEQLWNCYDKKFVDLAMEDQRKDIRISERDPNSPFEPES